MKKLISYVVLCGWALVFTPTIAQDLEKLKDFRLKSIFDEGVKLTGALSVNHTYYQAIEGYDRRTPFVYMYTGNFNATLLNRINIPISFSFTNQKSNFNSPFAGGFPKTQPFNRLSFKPKYKGSTIHLGTSALSFSQNTLAGFRFHGLGYEYRSNHSPIYGSFMYGRLLKAIPIDSSFISPQNRPAYKRMGFGGKVGYKQKQDFIELIYFQASDKVNSLVNRLDSYNIFPESNLAIAINFQKVFFQKLFINAEIARSKIFSEDKTYSFFSKLGQTIGKRSNVNKQAINTSIKYKYQNSDFAFEYSRVDPKYRTFGAYFINADLETYKLKTNNQFFDGKWALSTDLGYQLSNLDHSNPQALRRYVWGFDSNFTPYEKLNLSLNYSTFSNFSNFQNNFQYLTVLEPYQQLDTLNYRQINNNISGVLMYQMSTETDKKQAITINAIHQSGNDQQGSFKTINVLNNVNLNYGLSIEPKKISYSLGLNFIQNQTDVSKDLMIGPVMTYNRNLAKNKVQFSSMLSYTHSNNTIFENKNQSSKSIYLGRIGLQTSIKKVHKFNFSTLLLKVSDTNNSYKNITEITLNLGYSYQFEPIVIKSKK
ncbi:hypothetical protein Emtol_0776 [Emticicia oligotrophica DSM 17448]|uniref:DUF5723 domain-containing protein n=1 Tax=Emticicia oligotrophica (strain DSM 17448 / CIP 109782 / MTCC 6937 / GPTSA100-15) TaxID=929562 RepID=A0ABN4AIR1_EMTOG|nr:hypothetical protein [Emticicia oligotrophica]AFK01928.1 hypothetical protein Emtol_0776 [Emticicia oligotrophica DSM 17448]